MSKFAKTPEPAYYAVIFSSQRTEGDKDYGRVAEEMVALAATQPGFLGVESARDEDGFGITVSYWESPEAIQLWKQHARHQIVQQKGKQIWYESFFTRVAKVERASEFDRSP